MVQEKATLTRPLDVERWRLASPPMAQILQNSAKEAASLAARYWVSIFVQLDQRMCMFVAFQNIPKDRTGQCQDNFVCIN